MNLKFAFAIFVSIACFAQDATLTIGPFDRGMVTTRSQYSLLPNELSHANNCDFSTPGEIRCRTGYGTLGSIAGKLVLGSAAYPNDGGTAIGNNLWVFTVDGRGAADSMYFYNINYSIGKALTVRSNSGFSGMPSFEVFKRGVLFLVPSPTGVQKDSANTVRYSATFADGAVKTTKIGVPSCSLSIKDTNVANAYGAANHVTPGTHLYAATFRREYTLYGVTYSEEGNCSKLRSVTPTNYVEFDCARIKMSNLPVLADQWRNTWDGYNGLCRRIIYKSKAGGSTLYKIASIPLDSTTFVDSLPDDSINVFNPTYDEVYNNYCLDSLIGNFFVRGVTLHDNRVYVMTEGTNNFANARTHLYRTIPFTTQTPLLFNSTRRAIKSGGKSLFKTGMVSCGGRLYAYGLGGISVLGAVNDNLVEESQISDLPVTGSNCVECVDGNLWAMGSNGSVFSTSFGKLSENKVALVDSSRLRYATYWNQIDTAFFYKSYSFNVIRPFDKPILIACNDSSKLKPYVGYLNGNDVAWSRSDFAGRSIAGDPISNTIVWVDTSTSKLRYWPSRPLAQKDFNGTDSSTIDVSFSTGWIDFGSFNDLKQIQKIVMNVSLIDTMNIYTYWDGSTVARDTGMVWSQDTVMARHVGDCYTWFPPRKNVGRYLKLTFRHPKCTERKMRFRSAKVYCGITRM